MEEIVLPDLSEVSEGDDSERALRTYYNYISAFVKTIQDIYPGDPISGLLAQQGSLPEVQELRADCNTNSEIETCFRRGHFTIQAMKQLPVAKIPQLAFSANYWLPVQAYYAVHGIGLATLLCLNGSRPQYHSTFLSHMSGIIEKYFPRPLSTTIAGVRPHIEISGINVTGSDVSRQSNLEHPPYGKPELHVAKCLVTTRERDIDEQFAKARCRKVKPNRKYRQLKPSEKSQIIASLHKTTLCDFMYRIRIRSNYDDPDMYIFGQNDVTDAAKYYLNLVTLTEAVVACLENLIQRRIGETHFATIKERVLQRTSRHAILV